MITYRKASLVDIPTVNTLVNSAYLAQADFVDGQRTNPRALQKMIENENAHLELAIVSDEIIGCIFLERRYLVLYIGMLTVKPSFQNRGLGKKIMARALELGRQWKMKSTSMNVIKEIPHHISYYEKMGFKWSGKTEPFTEEDLRHGKPKKELTFLEYVMDLIEFRTAQKDDIKGIDALVNTAYRGDFAKKGWTTEADMIDGQRTDAGKLLEMIEDPNSQIELAFEDGKLVGCIHIVREDDYASFGMLTVYPTLQQRGLGTMLMDRFEKLALEWGYRACRLFIVTGRSELQSYYERRGFELTGNVQPFPEDPRFGLPKTKLQLHEMVKVLVSN